MELRQTTITGYERRLARISSCTEGSDTIVPDSYPDVGRVVCAYGTAAVRDLTPQNGRLLVSGTVQATVLYRPEQDGPLRRLSVPISFAHIEECDGLDAEAVCSVQCRVASVEAVPVNSRKLSISALLCFESEGYRRTAAEVTEQIVLDGLQTLTAPQTVTLIEQVSTSPITVLDDTTVTDGSELTLLHHSCSLRAAECRAMQGKVVIRGEAELQCIALQQGDEVRTIVSSTPFTQIIELPDAVEGDDAAVRLTVREVDCRLEADGLLSYTINANAQLTLRREKTISRIDDLYMPARPLQLTEQRVQLLSQPKPVPFTAEATELLQAAGTVTSILSVRAVCAGAAASEQGLTVQAAVQLLYHDEAGRLCALQRTLPLQFACNIGGAVAALSLSARASAAGEGGISLVVQAAGQVSEQVQTAFRHITALEIGQPTAERDGVTLLLRCVQQEQPLWTLAKGCGTTISAIRAANELPEGAQSVQNTMLLIPIEV